MMEVSQHSNTTANVVWSDRTPGRAENFGPKLITGGHQIHMQRSFRLQVSTVSQGTMRNITNVFSFFFAFSEAMDLCKVESASSGLASVLSTRPRFGSSRCLLRFRKKACVGFEFDMSSSSIGCVEAVVVEDL